MGRSYNKEANVNGFAAEAHSEFQLVQHSRDTNQIEIEIYKIRVMGHSRT